MRELPQFWEGVKKLFYYFCVLMHVTLSGAKLVNFLYIFTVFMIKLIFP